MSIRNLNIYALYFASLICLSTVLSSCSNTSLRGNNKKKETAKPQPAQSQNNKPKPTPKPTAKPTPVPTLAPTPVPTLPPLPPPTLQPTLPPITPANPPVNPPIPSTPVQPNSNSVGSIYFDLAPVSNMEKQRHAMEVGSWVVLRDGSTQEVIAAGPFTYEALCQARPNGDSNVGDASYPNITAKVNALALSESAQRGVKSNGQGLLSVCVVNSTNNLKCLEQGDKGGGDTGEFGGQRHYQWDSRPVSYQVSGNEVVVKGTYAKGSNGTVGNLLAVNHGISCGAAATDSFRDLSSPLVFDLNGNGKFDLVSPFALSNTVRFENMPSDSNDGKFVTGWVAPGDALLVMDHNANGKIDNGTELFGEYSKNISGAVSKDLQGRTFVNGFAALTQYDANKDGKIDQKDPAFTELRLWKDKNQNGKSETTELLTLKSQKIVEIGLNYYEVNIEGEPLKVAHNEIRLRATFKKANGKEMGIADVWFGRRFLGNTVAGQ